MNYYTSTEILSTILGAYISIIMVVLIASLLFGILSIIGHWRVFSKAGGACLGSNHSVLQLVSVAQNHLGQRLGFPRTIAAELLRRPDNRGLVRRIPQPAVACVLLHHQLQTVRSIWKRARLCGRPYSTALAVYLHSGLFWRPISGCASGRILLSGGPRKGPGSHGQHPF